MHMRTSMLVLACSALCLAGPASRPAASQPAPAAPTADAATMAILHRLEAAGAKYPNIVAHVTYTVENKEAGTKDVYTGKVYYQAGRPNRSARFRIHFETICQTGGPTIRALEDYAFDGAWLTIRKERIKQYTRYEVPPDQRANAFELGRGPFPVPFGQRAATVLKYFAASTRPPVAADPPGTDYLKLVTRPSSTRRLSVQSIQMWVDRRMGLPVQIIEVDGKSRNVSTVVFDRKTIQTPKEFAKGTFELPAPPRGRGWDVRIEKLKGQAR